MAFTDDTYDFLPNERIDENQERSEFYGDAIVNHAVVLHIRDRFPDIKSVKWLTRLKHNLISKRTLGMVAYEAGFEKYIRYGPKMKESIAANPDIKTNTEYLSMLEDTFEAFAYAVHSVVDKHLGGGGFDIVKLLIDAYLNMIEISLDPKKVFDAITRLKELYESRTLGIKWPIAQAYRKQQHTITHPDGSSGLGNWEVTVYGWPQGDRRPIDQNRVQLSRVVGATKDDTSQEAAEKAIEVLARNYKLAELPPNPYTPSSKTKR